AIGPAGLVHCSLQDWSRYIALHLAGARGEDGLLKAVTMDRMQTPMLNSYAMGWDVRERDWAGGRVLWHNGSNGMWYCETAIVPDRDLAVMVAMNRGDRSVRRGSHEALRIVFGHVAGASGAKTGP
ncbi:MAG: serine hydrolase domain-containing protein, partial [Planctomycetota bacterium]